MFRQHRSILVIIICLLILPLLGSARPNKEEEIAAKLAGSILINGRSMQYLRDLSDKFGPRLTGGPAYQRASEWAAQQFRDIGLKNVRLEPFTLPNGWQRGWAQARMLTPQTRPIHLEALGWTPSTPAGGVKGEVYLIGKISAEDIKAQAERVKGRIIMFDTDAINAEGRASSYLRRAAAYQFLKDAGALAVLSPEREPNNLLNARNALYGGNVPPLPVASIGMEDEQLIRRLLPDQPVTMEFSYENKLSGGPIQVNNVIAELPGREQGDEWVLIGAHLDSWDYGTGAQDNGSGCASVLDAARAIAALGQPPRRTIRFVLWGGEEQGLVGSSLYAIAHTGELNKCIAVLNTDNGAGHPRGWKVEGRADLYNEMKPISEQLAALGGDGLSNEMTYDTDHGPFFLQGVPALDLWVDMSHYMDVHHKSSDTLDKVDAHNLTDATVIIAITGYQIADRAQPIAPHIGHDAIDAILKENGTDTFLRATGVWK